MQPMQQKTPHYVAIDRKFLTEDELNKAISVVMIKVYGKYTLRGEHRKEVIEKDFDAEVEVPEHFNKGHIKLAANRHVRKDLRGIRVRTVYRDEEFEPKPLEHPRRVLDFMSEKGIRDNGRLKRDYERQIAARQAEADALAAGKPPAFADHSAYGGDGLPPLSDKNYVV